MLYEDGVYGNSPFGWQVLSHSTFAVPLLAMCADSMYLNGMAGSRWALA